MAMNTTKQKSDRKNYRKCANCHKSYHRRDMIPMPDCIFCDDCFGKLEFYAVETKGESL